MNSASLASVYQKTQARFSTDRWIQPLDLPTHRSALASINLEAESYPSHFAYDNEGTTDYLLQIAEINEALQSCDDIGSVAPSVQRQLARDQQLTESILSQRDIDYTIVQRDLFGTPSHKLVSLAQRSLTQTIPTVTSSKDQTYSSEQLAERMTMVLRNYGLSEWYMEVESNMAARASVNGSLHRIRLRHGESFTAFDADRLIVHEIGGHVLRWANSVRQPEPWASVPMGRTVPTEEGLAVCREEQFGLLDHNTIRRYQVRVLAIAAAAKGGIMDVIRSISPFVSREDAADIAIRTKRGLVDPNSPGGSTKDWGYYAGYLSMTNLRDSSPLDFQLLQSVKWPVEELQLIRELVTEGQIAAPRLLPDAEMLDLMGSAS